MVAAFSLVDALEQPASFRLLDATLVDVGYAALVQLVVDDGVSFGAMQYLSGLQLSLWEYVSCEVVEEGLCSGWCCSSFWIDGLVSCLASGTKGNSGCSSRSRCDFPCSGCVAPGSGCEAPGFALAG